MSSTGRSDRESCPLPCIAAEPKLFQSILSGISISRNRIWLFRKPVHRREDEANSGDAGQAPRHQHAPVPPQQPQRRRNHHQYAEPGDLPGRPSHCVHQRRHDNPHHGRSLALCLKSAQTHVETEHDAKDARYIRHEGNSQRKIDWRQNKGQRRQRGIPLVDAGPHQRALEQKRRGYSLKQCA